MSFFISCRFVLISCRMSWRSFVISCMSWRSVFAAWMSLFISCMFVLISCRVSWMSFFISCMSWRSVFISVRISCCVSVCISCVSWVSVFVTWSFSGLCIVSIHFTKFHPSAQQHLPSTAVNLMPAAIPCSCAQEPSRTANTLGHSPVTRACDVWKDMPRRWRPTGTTWASWVAGFVSCVSFCISLGVDMSKSSADMVAK